jgi:hypothetical protein
MSISTNSSSGERIFAVGCESFGIIHDGMTEFLTEDEIKKMEQDQIDEIYDFRAIDIDFEKKLVMLLIQELGKTETNALEFLFCEFEKDNSSQNYKKYMDEYLSLYTKRPSQKILNEQIKNKKQKVSFLKYDSSSDTDEE